MFPKKAEDLFEEVCSYVSHKKTKDPKLDELKTKYSELKSKLVESIEKGDYNESERLDKEVQGVTEEITKFNENREKVDISENDVLEAIGFIYDIPMTKLSKDKTIFLKNLPEEIKKDICKLETKKSGADGKDYVQINQVLDIIGKYSVPEKLCRNPYCQQLCNKSIVH